MVYSYQKIDIVTDIDYPPFNYNKTKSYFINTHLTDISHYFISLIAKVETFDENGLCLLVVILYLCT